MFSAVNSENPASKQRSLKERSRLREAYLNTLASGNIDDFLSLKSADPGNEMYLFCAKDYLLYNWVKTRKIEEIDLKFERYEIKRYRYAFFRVVERNIEENNITKARKMLEFARRKQWYCNQLYDCKRMIDLKMRPIEL